MWRRTPSILQPPNAGQGARVDRAFLGTVPALSNSGCSNTVAQITVVSEVLSAFSACFFSCDLSVLRFLARCQISLKTQRALRSRRSQRNLLESTTANFQ